MAFSSGFYNSINGDRRYNAVQMSSIFDGVILDGIFRTVGDSFMVHADSGMTVNVGTGRAWFNHTWSLNDASFSVTIDEGDGVHDRIDTIVLDINSEPAVRENSIRVLKGTPSLSPIRPSLIRSSSRNQYPLCDIRVNRAVAAITQLNITNRIGSTDTPFASSSLNDPKHLIWREDQILRNTNLLFLGRSKLDRIRQLVEGIWESIRSRLPGSSYHGLELRTNENAEVSADIVGALIKFSGDQEPTWLKIIDFIELAERYS